VKKKKRAAENETRIMRAGKCNGAALCNPDIDAAGKKKPFMGKGGKDRGGHLKCILPNRGGLTRKDRLETAREENWGKKGVALGTKTGGIRKKLNQKLHVPYSWGVHVTQKTPKKTTPKKKQTQPHPQPKKKNKPPRPSVECSMLVKGGSCTEAKRGGMCDWAKRGGGGKSR